MTHLLSRAVDEHEFIAYYEPQVNLSTCAIVGVEALVRWQDPANGLVSPADFLPLVDRSPLIHRVGEQVMRATCTHYIAWERVGIAPPRLSINIAARRIEQPDFTDRIETISAETGSRPDCLELEITESSLIDPDVPLLDRLAHLRARGIRIAVDDFGTGYSSLAYLKRLPLDFVKIDQSFVRDIEPDPDTTSIVCAIVEMAHGLHKTVVVEGVETAVQCELLQNLGASVAQGYYWPRPLPAAESEVWCARWAARNAPTRASSQSGEGMTNASAGSSNANSVAA